MTTQTLRASAIAILAVGLAACQTMPPAPVDTVALICAELDPLPYYRDNPQSQRDAITEFNAWLAGFCGA